MLLIAKKKYEELMSELACRKNNEHIGSGLGGNPSQYLTMLALTPNFSSVNSENIFSIIDETISINIEKIASATRKSIRESLDSLLTQKVLDKYADPDLVRFISGENIQEALLLLPQKCFGKDQSDLLVAAKLASRMKELVELEMKENSTVPINSLSPELQKVYSDLRQLEAWQILSACRIFLGLETIVKFNLDEIFDEMFVKINRATPGD